MLVPFEGELASFEGYAMPVLSMKASPKVKLSPALIVL
jgi:hypothetical protein